MKNIPGKLILLYGTSTSGKTSIANYICKVKTGIITIGVDYIETVCFTKFLNKYPGASNKYNTLLNFLVDDALVISSIFMGKLPKDYIRSNLLTKKNKKNLDSICISLFLFRKIFVETLQRDSTIYMDTYIETIIPHLKEGKTVVFDTAEYERIFYVISTRKLHLKIIPVLVYCGLDALIDRMCDRNLESLEKDHLFDVRLSPFYVLQFIKIYKKTSKTAIDMIYQSDIRTPKRLPALCKILSNSLKINPNSYFDNWEKAIEKIRNYFFFGATKNGMAVPIISRYSYSLKLDSGRYSTRDCAERLIKMIDSWTPKGNW